MSIESYYSVNKTPFLIEGNDKTIARGNIALAYAKPSHTSMSYQIVRLLLQSRTRERSKWFNLTYLTTETKFFFDCWLEKINFFKTSFNNKNYIGFSHIKLLLTLLFTHKVLEF